MSKTTLNTLAKAAIQKTIEFFHSIGIKIQLSKYTEYYEGTFAEVAKRLAEKGMIALGEHGEITPEVAEKIVEMSY